LNGLQEYVNSQHSVNTEKIPTSYTFTDLFTK